MAPPAQGCWAPIRGQDPVSLTLTPAPVPSLCEPLLGEGAHSPPARGLRAGPPGGAGAGRGRGGPGAEQRGDQTLASAPCQPWPRPLGQQQHSRAVWRGPSATTPSSTQASGAAGPMLPERCERPGENTARVSALQAPRRMVAPQSAPSPSLSPPRSYET